MCPGPNGPHSKSQGLSRTDPDVGRRLPLFSLSLPPSFFLSLFSRQPRASPPALLALSRVFPRSRERPRKALMTRSNHPGSPLYNTLGRHPNIELSLSLSLCTKETTGDLSLLRASLYQIIGAAGVDREFNRIPDESTSNETFYRQTINKN